MVDMIGISRLLSRLMLYGVLVLIALVMLACQPQETELPTLVPEPTTAPSLTPSETPPPTLEPTPTPQATNVPVFGRFATDPPQIGTLRVLHAAPDTGQIDLYVEAAALASNIEFGLSTGRTNILAGTYTLTVTPRGVLPGEDTLVTAPLTVNVGQSVLAVFSGVADAPSLTLVDESSEPLQDNESRVNFVHAVPLAPMVKGAVSGVDVSPLFDFGQQSGAIVVLSSPNAMLSFASSEQPLASIPLTLFPRTHYTAVLTGRSDALDSLTILLFENQVAGLVTMRFIQVMQGAAEVDVYLDGQPVADGLAYRSASERRTETDGSHVLSVYPADADPATTTPLVDDFNFSATTSDQLSVILYGNESEGYQVTLFRDDLSPLRPDEGRIAFGNMLPGVQSAQVGLNSTVMETLGTVGYGQVSAYLPILLGENRVFWQEVGGGFLEDTENFLIEGGRSYLYLLTGDTENPVVFSESVPVSAGEVVALPTSEFPLDTSAAEPTPANRTRIRVINATESGIPINFTLNGQLLADNLQYTQSTDLIEITPGTLPMIIQQSDNPALIVQRDLRLADFGDFGLFIYGPNYDVSAIAFPDVLLRTDEDAVTVRMVNLSLDETISFSLALAPATDPLTLPATPPPSVPLGLPFIVFRTGYRSVSPPSFGIVGVQDLLVADDRNNTIGYRFRSFNFEAGVHYDVVGTYAMQTGEIRAFILPYPQN
jgi:hypothetical protein